MARKFTDRNQPAAAYAVRPSQQEGQTVDKLDQIIRSLHRQEKWLAYIAFNGNDDTLLPAWTGEQAELLQELEEDEALND